jgi:hypothetical protein
VVFALAVEFFVFYATNLFTKKKGTDSKKVVVESKMILFVFTGTVCRKLFATFGTEDREKHNYFIHKVFPTIFQLSHALPFACMRAVFFRKGVKYLQKISCPSFYFNWDFPSHFHYIT